MKIAFIVSGILQIHYLHTHYAMHNFGNYAASCKLISYFDAFLLKCKLLYSEIIIQLYIYMIV